MLNVLLTVDTEFWPNVLDKSCLVIDPNIERDIYGATPQGSYGLGFQIETLNRFDLKAIFFTESLSARVVGMDHLRRIIQLIQDGGHEVQMHLHSEWLAWMKESPLCGKTGQSLKDFSQNDQETLIAVGLRNLLDGGARNVCAFRAGNYGANDDTLRALDQSGIRFDSSYNACYLETLCSIVTQDTLLQPTLLQGICEIPVSFFKDGLGHYRHAQICACSSEELESALFGAWRNGWPTFVIVSHSFELLKNRKRPGKQIVPDRIVIDRFKRLCQFLDENRDKFQTCGFSDLNQSGRQDDRASEVLSVPSVSFYCTAKRIVEQAVKRIS